VGVGVLVYLAFRGQDARPPRPAPPAYAGAYPPADAPASGPAYDPSVAPAYGPPAEGQQVGYPAEAGVGYADQPPAPPWTPTAQPAPAYQPQPQPRPKRGPKLFGFTLALVAVALGVLGLVDASGVHVVDSAYPALALAVIGLMLVVGAWVGRAGGLILLGIVAALALAVTSIVGNFDNLNFRDSKRVHVAPISAAGVRSTYDITSGRVVVDLSRVSNPQALDGRTIDVGARAGELVVVLPRAVESDVTAGIDGPGQIDFPDRSSGGINTDLAGVYGRGPGTVTIVTHLSAGHIDVRNP
jgi:hypothetical protein